MTKLLIATRANENIKEMTNITHKTIKKYADRCGADFIILDKDIEGVHPHWRILRFYDLFEEYDRIMSIDSDILILNKCPNLFEMVPENKIGTIFEDVGTRKEQRQDVIKQIQSLRKDIGWKSGYINTGVALFSRDHRCIFDLDPNNLWLEPGFDDVELRYQSIVNNIEIYELPFQFNHMTMFSEKWNEYASRIDSFIIHYAGVGLFSRHNSRLDQIKSDYVLLKKYNMV